MSNFERCQSIVAVAEGGANFNVIDGKPVLKPNAVNDMGGPTKYGITWGTLSKAYSQGVVEHNDIVILTKDEANRIYQANYWIPSRADKMPWGFCLVHYDCAVNCGVNGAGKQLQRAVNNLGGKLGIDGVIGPLSLEAINNYNLAVLIKEYCNVREDFYRGLVLKNPSQGVFLNGWLRRVNTIRTEALKS
jgi:lysozyme family protein